jgi:hypothetical protein
MRFERQQTKHSRPNQKLGAQKSPKNVMSSRITGGQEGVFKGKDYGGVTDSDQRHKADIP